MKILHLSDLHFGKSLCGVSLLENGDQGDWVDKLLVLMEEQRPDVAVIAGDVYDRGMPSGAAMQLLSRMVTGIAAMDIPVLITAGNHDSGERLSCFRELLAQQNVHIAGVLQREMMHVTLSDAHGPVTFWLLPYTFPAAAAKVLEDESIRDYDTAIRRLVAEQEIDFTQRNVIVAHQNVTNNGVEAIRGGSESMVGGVGQVDYTAFDGFDYAALGHIHAAYAVGRDTVRYAGSPMCYHFDELKQDKKGPLFIELGAKGTEPKIETRSIPPLHPMRELRGTYDELVKMARGSGRGEYIKLVLTDRPMTFDISTYFESVFAAHESILMERISEFRRFTGEARSQELKALRRKSVEELFADFYTERANAVPEETDLELLHFAAELLRNSDAGVDGKQVDPALPEQVLSFLAKKED